LRDEALSIEHSFAYVTDHIDLIRQPGKSWQGYCDTLKQASNGSFTLLPGLEVTCAGPDGDCLVYGLSLDADPVGIVNKYVDCAGTVASVHGYADAFAVVAHPLGIGVRWADLGCGYDGVQVAGCLGGTDQFWLRSVGDCGLKAAAIGGSDSALVADDAALGPVTWVYAPGWESAATWEDRVRSVNVGMRAGTTCASDDLSMAYFTVDGHLPGDRVVVQAGSKPKYIVHVHPRDTGHLCNAEWRLFRGTQMINNGTVQLSPGQGYSSPEMPTGAVTETSLYSLVVSFSYVDPQTDIELEAVCAYCGPTMITPA
jgi:hypothetical protein